MKELLAALLFMMVTFVALSRAVPEPSQSLSSRIGAELSCINLRIDPGIRPAHLYDVFTDCAQSRAMRGRHIK
jgi:hypothetical protein